MAASQSRTKPRAECRSNVPGVIDANSVYTLAEFAARTGIGTWGLRRLRRAGLLSVIKAANRSFICGAAWKAALEKLQQQNDGTR